MAGRENSRISAARLALAVKRLRAEGENLDLIASDPIAIVGMGCRFPGGAATPDELWANLKEGRDCVGEVPAGRWKDDRGKDADALEPRIRLGGYLAEIEGFDAAHFGISPREAQHMDPQQRLLLEVTWEALWDAGIEPGRLSGTDAGVFVAIYNSDYSRLHSRDSSLLTAHDGVGAAHSVAAGRLSFLLNIKGPSLAIDSACSSSLVATHLACQSLRTHECSMAIAAASSLKLLPDEAVVFSKWGMLSSDGKCKTFDAAADGFVPGEGSAAVVLKRLSDALQDGDRIHAVIRGTAVNHDGRTTVLTAPNSLAQEAVLRAALKNAMLEPGEISYVETHGTGTSLGDPIEMEAIRAVYGQAVYGEAGPEALPCILGAVKTNLGHLEAAAGLAGLIKVVLCLEHGEIPKNLHFHKLNPEISLTGSRLKIATENIPWKRGDQPRAAGISSFGLGGTNGHVILEEAPLLPARNSATGGRVIPLPAYRWQRQRFALAGPDGPRKIVAADIPASISAADSVHPLLGRRLDSPFMKGTLFEANLNTAGVPYLMDHRLGERAIVPFAAFLEMAEAAVREADKSGRSAIRNLLMHEPLFVSADDCRLQVMVGEGSIEIASNRGTGWKTNAKGSFQPATVEQGSVDLAGVRARCRKEISPNDIYQSMERTGLRYGASFRTIQAAYSGHDEALVHLWLPEKLEQEARQYGLHPALLDGCLQTAAIARGVRADDLFLPVSADYFEMLQRGMTEVWVHTKISASNAETFSADLVIADASGNVVARLTGFTEKRTDARLLESVVEQLHPVDLALTYEIAWRANPLASSVQTGIKTGEQWLLIECREGSCRSLADLLTQQGAACKVVREVEIHSAVMADASWKGIVYDARGVDARGTGSSDDEAGWGHREKNGINFVFEFVKSLAAAKTAVSKLRIIFSCADAVLPSEDVQIEQAPLWGMARTLALEYPETSPVLIDVGPDAIRPSASVDAEEMLAKEIASGDEPIVAFRGEDRYVARLIHRVHDTDAARKLRIASSGRLEDLRIEPAVREAPEAGQVEIEVRAAGLNFRDVLTALGMFPARFATPGAECAGTIVRVGVGVKGLQAGDDVLAFAPGSLQSFVNVPADLVARKPATMTFADAAGVPIVFLTALYGLDRLAKLSAGQSILIHAGAGGLGMAAVQLAMRAGAKVFATAGSEEKREFLKQLGVEHVFDSRSLAFRDQVLAVTAGAGVDVVLNSLAGDFIGASFEVTAKGGCFLEVGKRGIWSAEEVAALGKDIRYFPFDLGDVAMKDSKVIAGMLRELMDRFVTGALHPLPTALYSFENSVDAFRTMAQARHIGKIVLGVSGREARGRETRSRVRDSVAEGTVLITGGLGALGIETARWLASRGARSLVLAGRSAEDGKEHSVVAELRAQGVDVAIERADVAAADQLEKLLKKIRANRPPLRAVFHAAGVVHDSVLGKESWSSYCEATAPKIQGAWNLHRLTENDPLRLMVFYSSVASILGSPGQGSYAAGNAFLDALAHHRASRGLTTLSVNWGAWASAGMAARLAPEQAARWVRQGAKAMEPADALEALGSAIESGRTQVAIMDVDWQRLFREGSAGRDARLFAELRGQSERKDRPEENAGDAVAEAGLLESIRSASAADRRSILSAYIKTCARRALGLDESATIQDDLPLQEVGLDSLMAVEMRNELAQSLGLTLTAGLLFDYPSVEQLTQHLQGLLAMSLPVANELAKPGVEDRSAAALDSLSEEEAERLLILELDRAELDRSELDRVKKEKANA